MTITLLPTDAFVTAAFDELLSDVTSFLTAAQASTPLDRDEVKFWRGQQNALNRAAYTGQPGCGRPDRATRGCCRVPAAAGRSCTAWSSRAGSWCVAARRGHAGCSAGTISWST